MDLQHIFALFGSLILLFGIGIGPVLLIMPRTISQRIAYALCLAPTIGLISIGLLFVAMVIVLDIAIKDVAIPVLVGVLLISGLLAIRDFQTHKNEYEVTAMTRAFKLVVVGFIIVLLLLLMPSQFGGKEYQHYQANPWDATNYMIMGWYARNFSLSQIDNPPSHKDIVVMAPHLLHPDTIGRPVVVYVLAWLSSLFDVSVYNFYYYYKLLLITLIYFTMLPIGHLLRMQRKYIILLASVMTVGFWTQYVNDSDALSQISVIPISLLVLFAWVTFEKNNPDRLFSRERLLLGLSFGGLLNFYPEMTPILFASVGFYYLIRLIETRDLVQVFRSLKHIVTLAIAVVVQLASISSTWNHIFLQSSGAIDQNRMPWDTYFFPWLLNRESIFTGITGIYPYHGLAYEFPTYLQAFVLFAAIILSSTLIAVVLIGFLKRRSTESKILIALTIGFWLGGLVLNLTGREWVGGKAFTMGYPFPMILLFTYIPVNTDFHTNAARTTVIRFVMQPKVINGLVFVWIATQLCIPLLRTYTNVNNIHIVGYPSLDLTAQADMMDIFDNIRDPDLVVSDFAGYVGFLSTNWAFLLSSNTNHVAMSGVTYYNVPRNYWVETDSVPKYVVLSTNRNYLSRLDLGRKIGGNPGTVELYMVTPEDIDQMLDATDILSPDIHNTLITTGLGPLQGNDAGTGWERWLSESTRIRFLASGTKNIGIYMQYQATYDGEMHIVVNGALFDTIDIQSNVEQSTVVCLTSKSGTNNILITHSIDDMGEETSNRLLLHNFVFRSSQNYLDIGYMDESSIGTGWYGAEVWEESIRWTGQVANLTLLSCGSDASEQYQLRFRAFPYEQQSVVVEINGLDIGEIELEPGWAEYSLEIPQTSQVYSLTLRHPNATTPDSDTRVLGVAYDWFLVEN